MLCLRAADTFDIGRRDAEALECGFNDDSRPLKPLKASQAALKASSAFPNDSISVRLALALDSGAVFITDQRVVAGGQFPSFGS